MQTVDVDRLVDGAIAHQADRGPAKVIASDDESAVPHNQAPIRVLDVGCGNGRHVHATALLDDTVEVIGVDLDRERLRRAREDFESYVAPTLVTQNNQKRPPEIAHSSASDGGQVDTVLLGRADATSLPFPDRTFDVVICAEVLEHLPQFETAIDELARVLRSGGRLGVSVPRYGPEAVCWRLSDGYHETEGGHVRIFRREELEASLQARGLRQIDSHYAHALHSPYWWLKCLWWDRANDDPPAPLSAYERFLEWDVTTDSILTGTLERVLNPLLGKSLVLYYEK